MSADAVGEPGNWAMQETLLDAVSRLQTELRHLTLHQEGELCRRLGVWAEQQDQFAEIWYERYLQVQAQLEHIIELQEGHASNDSGIQSVKQNRAAPGPISMWESSTVPKSSSKPKTNCEEEPPMPPPEVLYRQDVAFEVNAKEENLKSLSSLSRFSDPTPASPCRAAAKDTDFQRDAEVPSRRVSFSADAVGEKVKSSSSPSRFVPCKPTSNETSLSSFTRDTGGTAMFSRDAHLHWRRMIRKENKKNDFMASEPLSERSRHELAKQLTPFQSLVRSRFYEMASLGLVILNAAFIGWQVEYFANHEVMPSLQRSGEIAFCILFSVELVLRVLAQRGKLFISKDWGWNVFDVGVVVMMLCEQLLDAMSSNLSSSVLSQMSMLRVLRLVRVVRVLKVIRVLKFFRELRMMVFSILSSFKSLAWAVMVQGVMFYIFGISLTQGVVDYCANHSAWTSSDTKPMRMYFGTLGRSCLSLFEAMAGGISWGELVDALEPLNDGYKFIFLLYISFAIFAVANIVTAVFVEGAMLNAQHDREVIIQEQMRSNQAYLESMQQIFYEVDRDADGCIDLEELRQAMKDERVVAYLSAFGLDITEVQTLFLLLDRDQKGVIDIEDFLLGCMRLKGGARTLDVARMQYDTEWIVYNLESLTAEFDEVKEILQRNVSNGGNEKQSDTPHCAQVRI